MSLSDPGYPYVARPGWLLISLPVIVSAFVFNSWGWLAAVPLLLLTVFLLYIFRDPRRAVPSLPLAVICPVDGRVLSVKELRDPYLQRNSRCVSLRVSTFGSYAARSPVEGNAVERWFLEDAGDGQPGLGIQLRTDEGDDVVIELARSRAWQSLLCYIQPGERVGQGLRCGYLRFGAVVRVYLPDNARLEVASGERVRSGSSILATLVHG